MSSTLKVKVDADCQGFKNGMEESTKAASQFATASSGSTKRAANEMRKAMKAAQTEAMNLSLAMSKLTDEQRNSDFGRNMQAQLDGALQRAGELKDMFEDVNAEIKNIASDTASWDAVAQGIGIMGDAVGSAIGIMAEMTGSSEEAQRALTAIATTEKVVNTVIQVGNALQKQSALMIAVRTVQRKLQQRANITSAASEAAVTAAVKGNTAAEITNTAATTAMTTATKGATIAQTLFNAVANANPYVLLATAIIGVGTALYAFASNSKKAASETDKLNDTMEKTTSLSQKISDYSAEETAKVKVLYHITQDHTRSMKERNAAANELKTMYPEYLGHLSNDAILAGQAAGAYKQLSDAILEAAQSKAAFDRVVELQAEIDKLKEEKAAYDGIADAAQKLGKEREKAARSQGTPYTTPQYKDDYYPNEIKKREEQQKKYIDKIKQLDSKRPKTPTTPKVTTPTRTTPTEPVSDLDKAKKALEMAKYGSEAWDAARTSLHNLMGDSSNYFSTMESELKKRLGNVKIGSDAWKDIQDEINKLKQEEIELTVRARLGDDVVDEYERVFGNLAINPKFFDGLTSAEAMQKIKEFHDALQPKQIKLPKLDMKLNTKGVELPPIITMESYNRQVKLLQDLAKKRDEVAKSGGNVDAYAQALEKQQEIVNQYADALGIVGVTSATTAEKQEFAAQAVANFGSALASIGSEMDLPALNIAGVIAQAIANIALGYSQATLQSASMGPWAWIAFAATGLVEMLSIISAIKNASSFSTGGIIKGSSAIGDSTIIRANAGEIILNNRQQKHLFDILDKGMVSGTAEPTTTTVKIKGEDIYLSLKNLSKRKGLSGVTTGIK